MTHKTYNNKCLATSDLALSDQVLVILIVSQLVRRRKC